MNRSEEDLAALLAEHVGAHHITVDGGSYIECDALGCDARWATVDYNGTQHAKHVAEVIAAAGWRKARAVTTAEELEQAIIGCFERGETASFRDKEFRHWIVWEDDYGLWHFVSPPFEDDPEKLGIEHIALPAIVLHEGAEA